MFNHFAAQKLARAGSASFGICEVFPFLDGSMLADDNSFLEAAAQGQTVLHRPVIRVHRAASPSVRMACPAREFRWSSIQLLRHT